MSGLLPKTIILITLVALLSACGPNTTAVPPTATTMPVPATPPASAPTAVPPPPVAITGQVISAETVARLEQLAAFDLPDSFINTVVFSPDGRALFAGDINGQVLVWERDTWEKTVYSPARSNGAAGSGTDTYFGGTLALSPDGNTVVTAYGDDGAVTGRDREGRELFAFSFGAPVYAVSISRDGKFLAVGGLKANVIVFDLAARQVAADLVSDHEYVSNLVFSPDGKTLLVCYERPENVMKTWDTAAWQETATFTHVTERIDYHDVLFSPDGRQLVIASTEDVEIHFLDLATRQVVKEFSEPSRAPYQLAFSPDGSLLASAGDDGTLRFWDMSTDVNVKTIRNGREAGAVAFSPDGTLIACSVWGEGVQVWAVASTSAPSVPVASPTPEPVASNTWSRTYGGDRDDVAWGILLSEDGGYYIIGTTNLEFEPQMRGDIYLLRTDAAGKVLWDKTYSKGGYVEGRTIARASDGSLLISGVASLAGTGGTDIFLLRVDPDGNELEFRTFGGPLEEMGSAWPQEGGGYLLVGNLVDPNDIVADPGAAGYGGFAGRSNIYVARTDAGGNEVWSYTYGGDKNVMITAGVQTADGGVLLQATIMGFPENDDDIYLLQVDAEGKEVWSRTWEEGLANGAGLVQTRDGGYLLAGSYSPPEVMDREKNDFLFIKVDPQGREIWRNVWGDPQANDDAALLAATADGGYIAVGDTGGSLSAWNQDIALLKLDAQGQLIWRQVIKTDTHQMYGALLQHPDGGYVLVGSKAQNGRFDIFIIKTDADGRVAE